MKFITTHVLDIANGRPAARMPVVLQFQANAAASWETLSRSQTGEDGRIQDLLPETYPRQEGRYRLIFDTASISSFFSEVIIQFKVSEIHQHYHIPLLLSHFGYTTYQGS
jgi:5-hydroxyisourate hydrolase